MGEYYALISKSESLEHHGVKGQKWGIRKEKYRSHSLRGLIASRRNKKVDNSFDKWKENASRRESAISKGKARNEALINLEKNRSKENKAIYKQANKDYKKALRANTTYRKGQVRSEVESDLSKKYLKLGKTTGNSKYYDKYNIERDRARRAPMVAAKRSAKKAAIKRAFTISAKAAVTGAAIYAGTRYLRSKNIKININPDIIRKAAKVAQYLHY